MGDTKNDVTRSDTTNCVRKLMKAYNCTRQGSDIKGPESTKSTKGTKRTTYSNIRQKRR